MRSFRGAGDRSRRNANVKTENNAKNAATTTKDQRQAVTAYREADAIGTAETIHANLKLTNPRAIDKRFECAAKTAGPGG